jgi:hypothetical protein
MILDRLLVADMIKFIEPVIPSQTGTGKNCLFIRVEDGNLICCGGNEFANKKVVLIGENAIEQSGNAKKKGALPSQFMIPRPELLAFKAMMDEHKAYCKKMAKNDPSYLHVEITDNELISHDGCIPYAQPKHEFKNLEVFFQIKREVITQLNAMAGDFSACLTGFKKSKEIEITFSGPQQPVHFLQGDYEAVMLPPTESVNDPGEQIEIETEED